MEARQLLHSNLKHVDPLLASTSARLLAAIDDRESIPAILRYCQESRAYAKTVGISALEDLHAHECIPALEQLCQNPNVPNDHYWYGLKGVRAAFSVLLLKWGNSSGLAYLEQLLEKRDAVVRRWYAPAILRIQDPVAQSLQQRLQFDDLWSTAENVSLKDIAFSDPAQICLLCDALALLDDPRVDDVLRSYLTFHSRYVRVQAGRALFARHGTAELSFISESFAELATDYEQIALAIFKSDSEGLCNLALSADSAFDRAAAIDGLTQINAAVTSNEIMEILNDPAAEPRYAVLEYALAKGVAVTDQGDFADDDLLQCRFAALELQLSREHV